MSTVFPSGAAGPSYWSYTASVLSDHLRGVVERRRTDPFNLPKGVHRKALDFLAVALEAASKAPSDEIEERLNRYADLVRRLNENSELTGADIQLASEVGEFFGHLAEAGEVERYVNVVRIDDDRGGTHV